MADPKRQLIRLIKRAQTDGVVREGQRERAVEKSQVLSTDVRDTLKEFHNLPGSDFLPPDVK